MDIEFSLGNTAISKDSYNIMRGFKQLILQNRLEDKVTLKASLNFEKNSQRGLSVKIGEIFSDRVSMDNLEHVFDQYVLLPAGRKESRLKGSAV